MWHSKSIGKLGLFALLGIALVLFAACASGVAQSEFEAAKKQATDQEQKAAALQQQLSTRVQETAALQAKLAAQEKELAEVKKKPTTQEGVTLLIGAKGPLPKLPPAPPPTPTPAGYVAPPKPSVPASYKEPVDFALYVETLATQRQSGFDYAATVNCVPSGVFKRGQRIVWRFEVYDLKAGKRLIGDDAPTVKVVIPGGVEKTATFSQRAGGRVPDAPWMWSANWDVPLDYKVGGLGYQITVETKDGRKFTWKEPALVGGGTDSRVQIFE